MATGLPARTIDAIAESVLLLFAFLDALNDHLRRAVFLNNKSKEGRGKTRAISFMPVKANVQYGTDGG